MEAIYLQLVCAEKEVFPGLKAGAIHILTP